MTFVGAFGSRDVIQMTANVSLTGSLVSVSVSLTTQGTAGYPDCRPLSGPVSLPYLSSDSTNLGLIGSLGVATTDIGVSSSMSLSLRVHLAVIASTPGGPTYNVPQVSTNLINTTLAFDPVTNPLGIYFCGCNVGL